MLLPQAPGGLCTSPNQRVTLLLLQETVPKKSDFSAKRKVFKTRVQFIARNTLNGGIREGFGLNAGSQGFLGIPGRLARNPPCQPYTPQIPRKNPLHTDYKTPTRTPYPIQSAQVELNSGRV